MSKQSVENENPPPIECPHCSTPMEIQAVGEREEKRLICPCCNLQIDLPNLFQQTEEATQQTAGPFASETRYDYPLNGDRTLAVPPGAPSELKAAIELLRDQDLINLDEETEDALKTLGFSVDTSSSRLTLIRENPMELNADQPGDSSPLPPHIPREIRTLLNLIRDQDPYHLDQETQEELRQRGFSVRIGDAGGVHITRLTPERAPSFRGLLRRRGPPTFDPEAVARMAATMPPHTSSVVPPEERTYCPRCNAAASIHEERCQWCGAPLP